MKWIYYNRNYSGILNRRYRMRNFSIKSYKNIVPAENSVKINIDNPIYHLKLEITNQDKNLTKIYYLKFDIYESFKEQAVKFIEKK